MRNYLIALLTLASCTGDDLRGVAMAGIGSPGPTVTITPRAAGELAVSWTIDAAAVSYSVFQSAADGPPALLASVFDSGGGPPATSYIATGLAGSTRYCYAIQATHVDGSTGEIGAPGCAVATGTTGSSAMQMLTIPIVPPTSTPSVLRNFASVAGSGAGGTKIIVPMSLPIGRTIVGVRARVADSSNGFGPSTFAHSLTSQSDGSEQFTTIATAQPSTGNGQEQTVSIQSLSVPIAANSEYFVILQNATGGGTTTVYRLNVDLQ